MKVTTKPCMMCGKTTEMEVDSLAFHRWQNERVLIQLAFPDMSVEDRETLITGTHGACWTAMFPDEDEDEDEGDDFADPDPTYNTDEHSHRL